MEYTTTTVAEPFIADEGEAVMLCPGGDCCAETVMVDPYGVSLWPGEGVIVEDTTTPKAAVILLVTVVGAWLRLDGAGRVKMTGTTAAEVEEDTNWTTEPAALLDEGGVLCGPAFYADGALELGEEGGTTVGGPAVATAGLGEVGGGGEAGPGLEPPEPGCLPGSVKLAHVRRFLSEACTTMLRLPTKDGVPGAVDMKRSM